MKNILSKNSRTAVLLWRQNALMVFASAGEAIAMETVVNIDQ